MIETVQTNLTSPLINEAMIAYIEQGKRQLLVMVYIDSAMGLNQDEGKAGSLGSKSSKTVDIQGTSRP